MYKSIGKKILGITLAVAMVIGGITIPPVTANAEGEFPEHFDLRDRGVVTPVKFQNPWAACWAFSGIAASEISILSEMGITNEEYKATHGGQNFDLSEKHLAWYAERPITAKTNPAQAGEGMFSKGSEDDPNFSYENGGLNLYISSLFATGVGPVFESLFPYQGAEGLTTVQYAEKYPDKARAAAVVWSKDYLFTEPFEDAYQHMHNYPTGDETTDKNTERWVNYLKKKGIMPDDQDLNAVTVDQLKEWVYQAYIDKNKSGDGNSEYSPLDDWTIPELSEQGYVNRDIYSGFTLRDANTLPEFTVKQNDKWQAVNWTGINAAKSELMKGHGISIGYKSDKAIPGEAETGKYINLDTWAQYTYEDNFPSHAVCIVGWDDNFSADNFNEGHRPPGDGAWIVKNSWGSDTDWYDNGTGATINKNTWGIKNDAGLNTGYFYLSYYDKSVENPETFAFDSDLSDTGGNMSVWSHDYMPSISSFGEDMGVRDTNLIKTANVFKNDTDVAQTLYSVSTKTSSPNASVNYSVYKLNNNATSPEDGELIGSKTATYDYIGFHRENLDGVIIIIPPGETIAIVAEESIIQDGQKLYELTVNAAPTKESLGEGETDYGVAVVNSGESFYYSNGKWADWSEAIPKVKEKDPELKKYELDNFSIKAYMVSTSEAMYRLYNPNTGEHIYTSDSGEKDYLSAIGWNYEGIGWNAPVSSDTPVYRLFNPFTSEHYYTTNEEEMFYLSVIGWNYEGIGWYSADNGMPIYRVFNPYNDGPGAHHYTADSGEVFALVIQGWNDEGIGWYGL